MRALRVRGIAPPTFFPSCLYQALRSCVLQSKCKMEKSTDATTNIHISTDAEVLHIAGDFAIVNHGTELDQEDMARMGKDQVFKVWPYLQLLKRILTGFSESLVTILYSHFPWS